MDCHKLRNYKTLLQIRRDGEWVDGGEFPPLLGSFATIPKAKHGLLLDRTHYRYLDAVHMDVAFRDCLSVGGYRYALILVDPAIHYNWTFGLKSLSSEASLAHSISLGQWWAPLLVASTAIVTRSYLVWPSQNTSSTTSLKLLVLLQSGSLPMAL
jgi:hypothetical protein